VTSVPFTVVGETTFSGWSDRNEAREKFASVVEQCIEVGCTDKLFETLPEGTQPVVFPTPTPQDASLKDTQKESQEKLDDDSTKEVSLVTLPVEISLPLGGDWFTGRVQSVCDVGAFVPHQFTLRNSEPVAEVGFGRRIFIGLGFYLFRLFGSLAQPFPVFGLGVLAKDCGWIFSDWSWSNSS
jgi:hypothetical protein